MELTASDLWSRILQGVKAGLPEQAFRTWLAGTKPVALSEEELMVEAPGEFHVEWLEDKYGALLEETAARILGRPLSISFSVGDSPVVPAVPTVELSPATGTPPGTSPSPEGSPSVTPDPALNRRYTFERFVVGGDNQLAAAACSAVAENPARSYNPLFLYGGVGLGKTHLMHAIGNAILDSDPSKRVAYVPTEQFMNELVTAIQEGTTADFRRRYRLMDLLLVDDVHFLEGKERTQEEFFHTFNALYDAHKQIVLTSDRPPKEIPGLEERLVSRFEWGLVADIQAPDYETRVAILRKKASDDTLTLDPEVIDFIARSCTSSVRELEGAVRNGSRTWWPDTGMSPLLLWHRSAGQRT
jgi:chromosomal replication initiator protein